MRYSRHWFVAITPQRDMTSRRTGTNHRCRWTLQHSEVAAGYLSVRRQRPHAPFHLAAFEGHEIDIRVVRRAVVEGDGLELSQRLYRGKYVRQIAAYGGRRFRGHLVVIGNALFQGFHIAA